MNVLEEIVAHKRTEVAAARELVSLSELERQAAAAEPPRDFLGALKEKSLGVIAEVKRSSPSAGAIRTDADPVRTARLYAAAGASCISVLTDLKYFGGSLDDLRAVKAAVSRPILRKEFIIDRYQIVEARAAGADAVLLIAECLTDDELSEFYREIRRLGMHALIELFEPENLERVLRLNPEIVGVNNRNLKTLVTDFEHGLRLRDKVPSSIVFVAESGIRTRAEVDRLRRAQVNAVLIGETLMRAPDPTAKYWELFTAANS